MLYQLPNGKTISISFEQFLSLTDEDIQYLVSINYGDVILSPFHKSSIKEKRQKVVLEDDTSIDYVEESDEVAVTGHPIFVPIDDEQLEIPDLDNSELE